jgi:hypothetical protein
MDGLADLFKHFIGDKLLSIALLIASLILIVGPHYTPLVPAIPGGWQWIGFGIMVVTGVQCSWWTIRGLWHASARFLPIVRRRLFPVLPKHLTKDEEMLLEILVLDYAHRSAQISSIGYTYGQYFSGQLALLDAAKSLEKRGLLLPIQRGYAGFTDEGRSFALKFCNLLTEQKLDRNRPS